MSSEAVLHAPSHARIAYAPLQIIAHWLTALLVGLQWYTSGGVLRTHEMHPIGHRPDPFDLFLHKLHIYAGVAMLGLVVFRLALRWRYGAPDLPATLPAWAANLAKPLQFAMYGVLAALSVTGLVTTYFWFGMSSAHRLLVNLLYVLIALHVAAAVWHDFLHRTGMLARMLPAWTRHKIKSNRG
jgi:cytochrome b561